MILRNILVKDGTSAWNLGLGIDKVDYKCNYFVHYPIKSRRYVYFRIYLNE